MKKVFLTLVVTGVFAMGLVLLQGCGGTNKEHSEGESHEHMEGEADDHSKGEASEHMDMSENIQVMDCPKWEKGAHKHATYICPMWEEEGELEKPGDCPKCGMKLLAFADVETQHNSQNTK